MTPEDRHEQADLDALRERQRELERRFAERTAELEAANAKLRAEIMERERADSEARDALRFVDAIVENLPDMIFVKEAEELRFVRFNRAGEELIGYPREEMIGKNDHDFFPKDEADFFNEQDRRVLSAGEVVDIPEEPIHTREHGVRWLHTKKVPIRDEAGRPAMLLGISEDITERRLIEQELDRKAAALERSNADLEQFATVASHDLQEPLRKIASFGELLRRRLADRLNDDERTFIDEMERSADRMQRLIRSLLALARVTTGGEPFAEVDLGQTLREVESDLGVLLRETGGRVTTQGDLPVITADPVQMRQLLQNLIGNALKFRRPDVAPVVQVAARLIEPEGRAPGGEAIGPPTLELRVQDNGAGFDPRRAREILYPFRRLQPTTERAGLGMGSPSAIASRTATRARSSPRARPARAPPSWSPCRPARASARRPAGTRCGRRARCTARGAPSRSGRARA